MTAYQFDPLTDPRWGDLLLRHPRASAFHTPGWLEALRRTYGFEPIALTTSRPGQNLRNGLLFCLVKSWLTGRRLVSLPFSDHCEPLVDSVSELQALLEALQQVARQHRYKYVELRPVLEDPISCGDYALSQRYYRHCIDLRPTLEDLLSSFDTKCVQRRIRHAEREGIRHMCGDSEELLLHYYKLVLITRRRQGLPPQPLAWYRNLLLALRGAVTIHLAYHGERPIAGTVVLMHKQSAMCKYATNDEAFRNLAGMQLALWKSIQEAKSRGAAEFDMGRTDLDQTGLVTFKNRWGCVQSELRYWRYPAPANQCSIPSWKMRLAKHVLGWVPRPLAEIPGRVLYRHFG